LVRIDCWHTQPIQPALLKPEMGRFAHLFDRRHYRSRRSLVDHEPGAGDPMQGALSDLIVKSRRLFVDWDQSIFLAGDDRDRHLQGSYSWRSIIALGIIYAVSAALARIWDGRTAMDFGKPLNFSGTRAGPNSLRICASAASHRPKLYGPKNQSLPLTVHLGECHPSQVPQTGPPSGHPGRSSLSAQNVGFIALRLTGRASGHDRTVLPSAQ
jgi:hypothetical protein